MYAFVAKGNRVVCRERMGVSGKFQKAAWDALERLRKNPETSKLHIPMDRYTMSFKLVDDLAFMCMASLKAGQDVPFMFLKKVSEAFFDTFDGTESDFDEFGPILVKFMTKFADPRAVKKMSQISQGLREVKDVMVENIEKVLKRGEKLEVLEDRTEILKFNSETFRKRSRNLRVSLCWANAKSKLFCALVVIVILYFLVASVCGLDFSECGSA